jgi:hypothetical protein
VPYNTHNKLPLFPYTKHNCAHCDIQIESLHIMETEPSSGRAKNWTVSHWPGVNPGAVHLTSLAETVAMAHVCLAVLHCSPAVSLHHLH